MHKSFIMIIALIISIFFCGTGCADYRSSPKTIERINYEKLPPPGGPFSHAVKYGNLLYISGMTAYGSEAQDKNMAEQAKEIWKKIKIIAETEGTDMSSLIKVTTFITDFSQVAELRKLLIDQYSGHLPASSMVEVSRLFSPDINIEIEVILGL